MTNNTCLSHYGVKGMKWGVRKDPSMYQRRVYRKMQKYNAANPKKSTSYNYRVTVMEEASKNHYIKAGAKALQGFGVLSMLTANLPEAASSIAAGWLMNKVADKRVTELGELYSSVGQEGME